MSAPIPEKVLDELLGRGLSYQQWRTVLEGDAFDSCIGGRYFTEWQRLWQQGFGCRSFKYTHATKQRIVEQEFNMFRSEIECMILEGYSFKSIARRLRGEVWTVEGLDEKEDRLKMQRLFGCDARSRMFRSAARRWKMENLMDGASASPRGQTFQKCLPRLPHHPQMETCLPTRQEISKMLCIPESLVTTNTGKSFRCSFSTVAPIAVQSQKQPVNPETLWMVREKNLCRAMFDLKLGAQKSKEELRAMKADLQSLRSGFKEHEKEIALLKEKQISSTAVEPCSVDEPEVTDRMSWSSEKMKEERCRSRRRGRIFPSGKPKPTKAARGGSCPSSRIPIRISPAMQAMSIICSVSPRVPPAVRRYPQLPIPSNIIQQASENIQRHRRGLNQNRDSGYGSPSSTQGSTDTSLTNHTYPHVSTECVEY